MLEDSDNDEEGSSDDAPDPVGNGPATDQLPNGRDKPTLNGERHPADEGADEDEATLNTSSHTNGHIHSSSTTVEQKRT